MADIERIAPPVPTLPSPVGRNVGSGNHRRRPHEPPPRVPADSEKPKHDQPPDHIDEYV
jgi:hypothetical protein